MRAGKDGPETAVENTIPSPLIVLHRNGHSLATFQRGYPAGPNLNSNSFYFLCIILHSPQLERPLPTVLDPLAGARGPGISGC
jgi:hypothetical protein